MATIERQPGPGGDRPAMAHMAQPLAGHLTRRSFFGRSAGAVALGAMGAPLLLGACGTRPGVGYGPLVADPRGLLDLPDGFTYTVISREGTDVLGSGHPVPGAHDGMAAFPHGDGTVVVRNHELSPGENPSVPRQQGITYDPWAAGGTTNLVLDGNNRLVSSYASLAGTVRNCGGGPTPWGTWITCEETVAVLGGVRHGYAFEVDPWDRGVPIPFKAMGRFPHEAIAVDPSTGIVYQTEDAGGPAGRVYRFLPNDTGGASKGRKGSLGAGGLLQAMRVPGVADLADITTPGTTISGIEWQTTPVVDPAEGGISVRESVAHSSTAVTKCEGTWFGNGDIYFASSRGDGHDGQVFRYSPSANALTLVTSFRPGGRFDGPDHITVGPAGDVFLCEDGDGEQFVVGLSPDGDAFPFARNALNGDEVTGVCFRPDGRTMYVNIQRPGHTFAITGPFREAAPENLAGSRASVALPVAGAAAAGLVALRNRRQLGSATRPVVTTPQPVKPHR